MDSDPLTGKVNVPPNIPKPIKLFVRSMLRKSGWHLHPRGTFGHDVLTDLRRLLPSNPICVDVGAARGQTVDEILGVWPEAQIACFEPQFEQFAALIERYGSHKSVTLLNEALGAAPGRGELNVLSSKDCSSLLPPTGKSDGHRSELVRLETKQAATINTLDIWCTQHADFNFVDFLKIDTQGSDLNVLKGACSMLTGQKIEFVQVEVMFEQMYVGQPSFVDVLEYMHHVNYRFFGMYGASRSPVNQWISWADLVFRRIGTTGADN